MVTAYVIESLMDGTWYTDMALDAKKRLWAFAQSVSMGMLPNRFQKKEPQNTTMWMECFSILLLFIGQVSEIFDTDAPHHPRGCVAQAWGVAEVLRVMKEYE
jgi:hypothetical protein